jgi:hypothetical protein
MWCTIADVKITFPDELEANIKKLRELLADSVVDNNSQRQ